MSGIILCDTTLRDGEQAPGVAFSVAQKVRIASLLAGAGVREIEAGTPVSGGEEARSVEAIVALGLPARISAWCRALKTDVDAALGCGAPAVAIAIPVSAPQLKHKLRRNHLWAARTLAATVAYAKGRGLYVTAALEDAGRAKPEVLALVAKAALGAGADRLRLSDTVGVLDPFSAFDLVRGVREFTDAPLEFHAHNDFGLATANALAAYRGGATHLSTTVLGLGERAGNAALEEVAVALERLMEVKSGIRLRRLPPLFRAVEAASRRAIPAGKPIAGALVFTHESGVHVDGLLKDPSTYEAFPPALVGRKRAFTLGKHSGAGALAHHLSRLGLDGDKVDQARLLAQVRERAVKNRGTIKDAEVIELYEKERAGE